MKQIVSAFKPLTKGEKVVKAFSYKPGKEFSSVPVIITENPKADEMYGPFASYIWTERFGEMSHSYYHPDLEDAVDHAKNEIKDDAEQGNLDPSMGQQRLPFEEAAPKNNPVAKNAGKFNKAQVQTDKKKAMKKGKHVKHKGKEMQMESSPVFSRYVKPLLDKKPTQIVEFYDRESLNIIDRLSQERRALAEKEMDTQMHEAIIGKLREGLSALSEKTLAEARRRRYGGGYRGGYTAFPRSRSGDINRIGYGDGRGANLGSDKAAFKRREMEVELGDEEPWRSRRPQMKGMFFYDVPQGEEEKAASYGIKPTKSGKMAMKIYDTSGRSTSFRKQQADQEFGQGKWWSPNR